MADDATSRTPGVFELPRVDNFTDTRDLLAHAAKDAHALKDTFVVDVDAHLSEFAFWGEIVDRIDNDVYRQMAQSFRNRARLAARPDERDARHALPGHVRAHSAPAASGREDRRLACAW